MRCCSTVLRALTHCAAVIWCPNLPTDRGGATRAGSCCARARCTGGGGVRSARPRNDLVEGGGAPAWGRGGPQVAEMGDFLRAEFAGGPQYLPAGPNVLRAFTFPFDQV